MKHKIVSWRAASVGQAGACRGRAFRAGDKRAKARLRRIVAGLGLGLLVLLLGCPPALAQKRSAPPSGQEITLARALDMALTYSPNIKQYLAAMDQAAGRQKEAFTYFLPSFSTSYG